MNDYSKEAQTKKNRGKNPKKMPKQEYREYVDFVNDRAKGMCQCGCGRPAQDMHHSMRGINKDDRSVIAICRTCHTLIHSCEYNRIDEISKLTLFAKKIGKENWKAYNG